MRAEVLLHQAELLLHDLCLVRRCSGDSSAIRGAAFSYSSSSFFPEALASASAARAARLAASSA